MPISLFLFIKVILCGLKAMNQHLCLRHSFEAQPFELKRKNIHLTVQNQDNMV